MAFVVGIVAALWIVVAAVSFCPFRSRQYAESRYSDNF
jgi:hypothetical protein